MQKKDKEYPHRERGARLAQIMEKLGIKSQDLAKEMNRVPSVVSRWVHGEYFIPEEVYNYLYEKHKVRFEYSIRGEGRMILHESEQHRGIIDFKKVLTQIEIYNQQLQSLMIDYKRVYNLFVEQEQEINALKRKIQDRDLV